MYLCKILKNFKLSLYHLKLSHKLNRRLYVLKKNNFYQKYLKYLQRKVKRLCYYAECKKKQPIGKVSLCSGCKSIYYCSIKCQRLDWTLQHRYQCIKQHLSPLSRQNSIRTHQMQFMLSNWARKV